MNKLKFASMALCVAGLATSGLALAKANDTAPAKALTFQVFKIPASVGIDYCNPPPQYQYPYDLCVENLSGNDVYVTMSDPDGGDFYSGSDVPSDGNVYVFGGDIPVAYSTLPVEITNSGNVPIISYGAYPNYGPILLVPSQMKHKTK